MLALESDDESVADTEAAATSKADFLADTADEDRVGRAICNNRNLLPTTSLRRPGSRPIDNIDNATARHRPFGASV